jgi:hypothetical protein
VTSATLPVGTGLDMPARAGPVMRFARAAPAGAVPFLVTGAVLTIVGVVLASGAVLLSGVLLLLAGLLHEMGASGCTSADQLAGWPWRG